MEKIPFLNRISFIGGDCHLEGAILTWLHDVVRSHDPNDARGFILLSHHQYYSSFDGSYTKPARNWST